MGCGVVVGCVGGAWWWGVLVGRVGGVCGGVCGVMVGVV